MSSAPLTPKVSVIIPTLNRAALLRRGLTSLFNDDYPNLEVIVIDGGSSDATREVLKDFGPKLAKWLSEPDQGEYSACNKGLRLCSGEIVKLLPDDDVLRPGAIRAAVDWFAAHPETDIVFTQAAYCRDEGGTSRLLWETSYTPDFRFTTRALMSRSTQYCSAAAFLRRKVFDQVGLFDTDYTSGDTEFWMRCASLGIRAAQMPGVFFDYHFTGTNGVITKLWELYHDQLRIYARYCSPIPVPFFCIVWFFSIYLLPRLSYIFDVHPFRMLRRLRARRPTTNDSSC
jgi:glycosyltransferase involved in cell wall biosynthesis